MQNTRLIFPTITKSVTSLVKQKKELQKTNSSTDTATEINVLMRSKTPCYEYCLKCGVYYECQTFLRQEDSFCVVSRQQTGVLISNNNIHD